MGELSSSISIDRLSISYLEHSRSISRPWGVSRLVHALRDVSLTVEKGENVALIGRNGAGKSTLLKALSGLIRPSDGRISTNGRVVLLSGTNPGFIPSLSGRENLTELALAYGIDEMDVDEFSKTVQEFAEIEDAIDKAPETEK